MKKIMIPLLCLALTMTAAAQTKNTANGEKQDTTVVSADNYTAPQFPGGKEAQLKFLKKTVKYPTLASDYNVEGKVTMSFFVGEDGKVSDITAHDCQIERFNTTKFSQVTEVKQKQLKEQFAMLFAKEGARAIRKMPKWTPGTINGKPTRMKSELIIKFSDPSK